MRKFLLLLTTVFSLAANSQEIYESFLQEGKVWTFSDDNYWTDKHEKFTMFIQGDTIIDGNACKKVYRNDLNHYQYALSEEYKAIYIYFNGKEKEMLYDFNKKVGDKFSADHDEDVIAAIDTVKVGERFFRRFISENMEQIVWIEGIGGQFNLEIPFPNVGNTVTFVSCEQNGEILITASDYRKPSIAGIGKVSSSSASVSSKVYSADGKQLDRLEKGLNIIKSADGKTVKVMK